jgi:phosphate transport system substrate-binding protein
MKLIILATLISQVLAQSFTCGGDGEITSRGSTTVFPITERCAKKYTQLCKNVKITYNGTGTSSGLRSICGDTSRGETPTDIGNMSRDFTAKDATPVDGKPGFFKCNIGDTTRQAIRMPVAIDGLTLFVEKNHPLYTGCVSKIPSFDVKIIRWMFSNLTTLEDDTSMLNPFDKDPATRFWSEIDAVCPKQTIVPIGPSAIYGTTDYFKEIVFTGGALEGFRSNYMAYDDNSVGLRDAVLNTAWSVGFMGFAFYNLNSASLAALPIDGVLPSKATLEANEYKLFARRIYSMYFNNPASLAKTKCFGDFTYTPSGNIQVQATGFLPIPEIETGALLSLLPGECLQPGRTNSPTPKPTRAPVCRCLRLLKFLRLCCRK